MAMNLERACRKSCKFVSLSNPGTSPTRRQDIQGQKVNTQDTEAIVKQCYRELALTFLSSSSWFSNGVVGNSTNSFDTVIMT